MNVTPFGRSAEVSKTWLPPSAEAPSNFRRSKVAGTKGRNPRRKHLVTSAVGGSCYTEYSIKLTSAGDSRIRSRRGKWGDSAVSARRNLSPALGATHSPRRNRSPLPHSNADALVAEGLVRRVWEAKAKEGRNA